MNCTESSQRHQVQQQEHSTNRLMLAMVEDLEDEAMEEALAMVKASAATVDRLVVTIVEL